MLAEVWSEPALCVFLPRRHRIGQHAIGERRDIAQRQPARQAIDWLRSSHRDHSRIIEGDQALVAARLNQLTLGIEGPLLSFEQAKVDIGEPCQQGVDGGLVVHRRRPAQDGEARRALRASLPWRLRGGASRCRCPVSRGRARLACA
ncbi:MAG: hypothetical protein M0Z28_01145 [Rhodospirillales bacterium]|nr:hypothetical protein [Rhodospirillales bacterium]